MKIKFNYIVLPVAVLLVLIYLISAYYVNFARKPVNIIPLVIPQDCSDSLMRGGIMVTGADTLHMVTIIVGDSVMYFHRKTILPPCVIDVKALNVVLRHEDLTKEFRSNKRIIELIHQNHEKLIAFKFLDSAKYEDFIFALNELKKGHIKRYLILNLDQREKAFVQL